MRHQALEVGLDLRLVERLARRGSRSWPGPSPWGCVTFPSIRTSVTVPSGSRSPCWASAGDVIIPGGSTTSTATRASALHPQPQALARREPRTPRGAIRDDSAHAAGGLALMIRPPGTFPGSDRSLISDRLMSDRSWTEPIKRRLKPRHAAAVVPGLAREEDRLRPVGSPASAGGRGDASGLADHPGRFRGGDDRTLGSSPSDEI